MTTKKSQDVPVQEEKEVAKSLFEQLFEKGGEAFKGINKSRLENRIERAWLSAIDAIEEDNEALQDEFQHLIENPEHLINGDVIQKLEQIEEDKKRNNAAIGNLHYLYNFIMGKLLS